MAIAHRFALPSRLPLRLCASALAVALVCSASVQAQTVEYAAPATVAPAGWTAGAVLRARWDVRFNDVGGGGQRRTSDHLSFDTFILKADFDGRDYFASAQYRFYGGSFLYPTTSGYRNYPGEVGFPLQAYAGRRLANGDRIAVGLPPVVLDDQYWGAQVLGSIGFVIGLEEVYAPGITYKHDGPGYRLSTGYYPISTPNGKGLSRDGARYSTTFVQADGYVPDGTNTSERDLLAATYDWDVASGCDAKLTAAVSGLHSRLVDESGLGHRDGQRLAYAASLKLVATSWSAKLLAARQQINLSGVRNPDIVTVGGFDASYNIATCGTVVFAEFGMPVTLGSESFNTYASYSRFFKDRAAFQDSERLTLGIAWKRAALQISTELLVGRNDPFVGAGQYLGGAAQGGDGRTKTSIFSIIGYHF
ncbi:hypothetical protein [Xanthomonas cucurbitae]|uniref:hypothetical protein n=1 Tax=Xanthomonas cucurbitae TaxID=56453 RepID=UPI001304DB73|nr:hypothetical protein [Xanthomonas cucurbitae]